MKQYDLEPILNRTRQRLALHALPDGSYSRWAPDLTDKAAPNPYGCADAVNLMYMLGELPENREPLAEKLRQMQDEDGLFREGSHAVFHTTAHCLAALELLDAKPLYPCTAAAEYFRPEGLVSLLDEVHRMKSGRGHIGAGIYAIANLTDAATPEWNRTYFRWFWEHTDPETGFWNTDCQEHHDPMWEYMGEGFHYLFNHEHAHAPLRYPEKMIDTCIDLWRTPGALPERFGTRVHFLELDWIYCLNRASRQTAHRFDEIRQCLTDFCDSYYTYLMEADWNFVDLHTLFGGISAFAELQQAIPGLIVTNMPLRLVLDRRPFI